MNSSMMRGVRRSLVLLATGIVMTGSFSAAAAQAPARATVQPMDSGARLRDHLTTLANNPHSLGALIGAGRAALEMGDADAALTFFGRADEVSPRHSAVKAGMGSALVHLGQPQAALSLFAEAVTLGAPEAEVAADRGLAYDLMGHPQRAQQDYVAALRRREDPELRRRLALSLAISGQREAALRLIDPQLRRNDRAAWRTQAFILALSGDAAGANRTAQAMMPAGAQAMAPFFARLPALNPSQKAMAVHLGQFPAGGAARPSGPSTAAADPGAIALAMAGAAPATPARTTTPPARSSAARRRPEPRRERERQSTQTMDSGDRYGLRANSRIVRRSEPEPSRQAERPAQQQPARQPEEQPAQVAEVNTRWAGSPYPAQPQSSTVVPQRSAPPPAGAVAPPAAATLVTPGSSLVSSGGSIMTTNIPASVPARQPDSALSLAPTTPSVVTADPPAPASDTSSATTLADIAAVVDALPQDAQSRPAPPRAAPERPARSQSAAAQPANPSRHWVQIAGGIDRSSLPREFARLRAMAPDQLGRRAAFTAPMRTTNRLLVGPFASAREAQDFVNQLATRNVAAFAWTSAAGQEIERLASR